MLLSLLYAFRADPRQGLVLHPFSMAMKGFAQCQSIDTINGIENINWIYVLILTIITPVLINLFNQRSCK